MTVIYSHYYICRYILIDTFSNSRGMFPRVPACRIGETRGMNCEFFMTTTFVAPILFDDNVSCLPFPIYPRVTHILPLFDISYSVYLSSRAGIYFIKLSSFLPLSLMVSLAGIHRRFLDLRLS